jgi:hypothetical protein
VTLPLSYSRLRASPAALIRRRGGHARELNYLTDFNKLAAFTSRMPFDSALRASLRTLDLSVTRPATSEPRSGESSGGEGRTRTFEGAWPTDLQSAAFDRFATSPMRCLGLLRPPLLMELAKGFEPPTG